MHVLNPLFPRENQRRLWCALFIALSCVLPLRVYAQCQYDVTIIAAPVCPGGGVSFQPHTVGADMSENGVVVGSFEKCDFSNDQIPFMWSEQAGFVVLPAPPQFISLEATGVSPNGRYIVGWGEAPALGGYWSVLWDSGVAQIIPPVGDAIHIRAMDVNDDRVIVGTMTDPTPASSDFVPFKWENGKIEVLTTTYSHRGSAEDINADSIITGHSGLAGINSIATVWQQDFVQLLEGESIAVSTRANTINSALDTGGAQNIPDSQGNPSKPIIWRQNVPIPMPMPIGTRVGVVIDGADHDVFVGVVTGNVAPIWINEQLHSLNDLIDDPRIQYLASGLAMNNHGRIIGQVRAREEFLFGSVCGLLTPVASPPGDLNKDCIVNTLDLEILFEQWNSANSFADIDESGNVDVHDLFKLLAGWG